MKFLASGFFIFLSLVGWSQDTTKTSKPIQVGINGYADTYYAYYLGGAPNALQVHNCIGAYNQTFGLNVAQLGATIDHDRFRGRFTAQFGDIPNIVWTGVRAIQEANAGVRIAKNTWVDLGYFKTHVGAESFLPKDNLMSQIALATFYGPFYQSGAKISHQTENNWNLEFHVISGYNRQIDDNVTPSIGLLIQKEIHDDWMVSYSNLFGREKISMFSAFQLFYHNIYTNFSWGKWKAQLSTDIAFQLNRTNILRPSTNNILIASLATFKRQIKNNFSIATKAEYFYDPSSINSRNFYPSVENISASNFPIYESSVETNYHGLNIVGLTIGGEYAYQDLGFVRLESRYLYNFNALVKNYPANYDRSLTMDGIAANRLGIMATIGIYFDKNFTFAE